MIEEITGIVISEQNYGDKSKIINVLSLEYGIVGIIAKGAKSMKSSLRSVTNKLIYGKFYIYHKKDKLSILKEVEVLNSFNNIRKSIDLISYASYLVDLACQVVNNGSFNDGFINLINSLVKIDEGLEPSVITNILELKYLDNLGVLPIIDCCAECGNTDNIVTLSSSHGGYLCSNCRTNEPLLNSKSIKLIRLYYYVDISKIDNLNVSNEISNEIDTFISNYYDRYTGLYLKSKNFLKNLKNM